LKVKYDESLSNLSFDFNLRRYTTVTGGKLVAKGRHTKFLPGFSVKAAKSKL
jgi:hypothetical protein